MHADHVLRPLGGMRDASTSSVEVLVASTAPALRDLRRASAEDLRFKSMSSNTASMITSALAKIGVVQRAANQAHAARLFVRRQPAALDHRPHRSVDAGEAALRATPRWCRASSPGSPALAKQMAMPPPMVPAPTMPADFTGLRLGSLGQIRGRVRVRARRRTRGCAARHSSRGLRAVDELVPRTPGLLPSGIRSEARTASIAVSGAVRLGYCLRACFECASKIAVGRGGRIDLACRRATRPLAARQQGAGVGDGAGTQIALDQRIDETHTPRPAPALTGSRAQDQFERLVGADQARQPLRAAGARNDAERHFGQAEARGRHGNAIVAGERDLEPSAQHRAVHRGDHRNARALRSD